MAVKKAPDKQPEEKLLEKPIAQAKPQAPAARTNQAAFYMYIGPAIRGLISSNAIYRKDELKRLDDALAKYPDIKHLLIPGEQLGAARIAIKKPDSFLSVVYNRLAKQA